MKEREKKLTKMKDKVGSKGNAQKTQQEKRAAAFVPPEETPVNRGETASNSKKQSLDVDLNKLKMKVKKMGKITLPR